MYIYAQVPSNDTLDPLIGAAAGIVQLVNVVLFAVIVVLVIVFAYQFITYMLKSSDDKKKLSEILNLVYSTLAISIFISVWGIADYLRDLAGIEENQGAGTVEVPDVDLSETI